MDGRPPRLSYFNFPLFSIFSSFKKKKKMGLDQTWTWPWPSWVLISGILNLAWECQNCYWNLHIEDPFNVLLDLSLSSVLHVPQFSFNLVSVSTSMRTHNCCITFFLSRVFQDLRTRQAIGGGHENNGLYISEP